MKEEAAHQQAYGFAVSLVQRIEDHPEYTPGMPVRIIGKVDFEDFPEDFFRRSGLTAYRNGEDIINYFRYDNFIRIYLGKSFDYAFAADDWTGEWYTAHQAEIDAMPPYPQAGGMRVMDGKLYIKFGEVA